MQYGNVSVIRNFPKNEVILHLSSLETVGKENVNLGSVDEVMSLVAARGCTHIMFYAADFPRRAVQIDRVMKYLNRLYK